MLRKGVKIVMTSRDYIYKRAKNDLKEGAFPLLRESQVVIDVHDLTAEEKQQILYNYMKLGRQPRKFRGAVQAYLPDIAAHPRFVPETARRLADPLFTRELDITRYDLIDFVEKQEHFCKKSCGNWIKTARRLWPLYTCATIFLIAQWFWRLQNAKLLNGLAATLEDASPPSKR